MSSLSRIKIASLAKEMRNKNCTYPEISKYIKENYGEKLSANHIRSILMYYSESDLVESSEVTVDALKKMHSARKGRSKANKENKLLLDEVIGNESFLEDFKSLLDNMKFKVHKPVKSKSKKKSKRTIFACLSDTHYGADIDSEEMGGLNAYGRVEEARRTAFFTKEIADFKEEHRKDTDLFLAISGDVIQGMIHNIDSTTNLTTQFARSLSIINQMVSYLATKFNKVKVISVTDNHGRAQHKPDKGRATRLRFDSYTTMLNIALEHSFKGLKNVEMEIPVTPYWYGKIRGHNYLVMHGDTTLNVGSVGKSINIDSLKNKINDLASGIGPIDVVVLGHLHIPVKTLLKNGTTLLVNGSLSGIDEYCMALGIVKNSASQKIFEITEEHAVGDLRDVNVLGADKLKELDNIIEPFQGKF